MPRVVKSRDEIFSRWGYCDNRGLSRFDNQSIERDRLIGIGFVLDFVEFISFTFGDKEMIFGKEHGEQLLDSVKNGPFKFGTIDVPGTTTSHATTKEKTLADLTPEEKILVQDMWDRFKLLMEGSELSLQKREAKLYNEFTSEKGETIHSYYLRFVKLINDMNTVGMRM
ncbi:hypothetical protein Tco_0629652 [Tanacetum coccineum]|uniref:Retrotransposon gag domain-containing protein n=1 Tax=Tanacetum coccineum TaxID=301880 RepID=A0ABQ4WTS5_9ASTR